MLKFNGQTLPKATRLRLSYSPGPQGGCVRGLIASWSFCTHEEAHLLLAAARGPVTVELLDPATMSPLSMVCQLMTGHLEETKKGWKNLEIMLREDPNANYSEVNP
jgi:hypothetical protein